MNMLLSIVTPIYNESESLRELHWRLQAVVSRQFPAHEIIFVDDRSADHSWEIIQSLCREDPHCRGIRLSKNMGEHIAVSAGLDEAKGDYVVLMDSDLQDQPEHIPLLFQKLQQGYDMVYALRKNRKHSFFKRGTSSLFWWFLRALSGLDIPRDQATLRIMTKRFRDALCALPEKNRFVYGLTCVIGFAQKGVEVEHGERRHGKSGYTFFRLVKLAATGITSLSTFPLLLSFYLGFLFAALASVFAFVIIVQKIFFHAITEGWASLITAIIFMGGTQMMMIGILGVYLGRNYIETKNRPLYFISDQI